jgi:hypothetical protein
MSMYDKMATAYLLAESIASPETHIQTRVSNYIVAPDSSKAFVPFSGTTSRFTVQHNTAGVGIGNIPFHVTFSYRRIGSPEGVLSIGIRKALDDSFQLLAEHPVIEPKSTGLIMTSIEGFNSYEMLANDKISLEYEPNDTDTIELACGTSLPTGFTSQSYDGESYAATTDPIAIKIRSKVLTAK